MAVPLAQKAWSMESLPGKKRSASPGCGAVSKRRREDYFGEDPMLERPVSEEEPATYAPGT
jgi:hypothetical protein